MINTTHGLLDESLLARTVGFEDRPCEFVVWVEWRLVAVREPPSFADVTGTSGELVRRDAHVILKEASVVADALAAQIA